MRPHRLYYILTTSLFFTFIIWGMLLAKIFPAITAPILEQLAEKFQDILNASNLTIFFYIFFNNSLIDLIIILSFFLFGLAPLFFLSTNGFVIGVVINEALKESSILEIAAILLPHGILEIPAFIIASSYGLWLGIKLLKKIFFKEPFKPHFNQALKTFFTLILPLNLIAAFIETYITPLIYSSIK